MSVPIKVLSPLLALCLVLHIYAHFLNLFFCPGDLQLVVREGSKVAEQFKNLQAQFGVTRYHMLVLICSFLRSS